MAHVKGNRPAQLVRSLSKLLGTVLYCHLVATSVSSKFLVRELREGREWSTSDPQFKLYPGKQRCECEPAPYSDKSSNSLLGSYRYLWSTEDRLTTEGVDSFFSSLRWNPEGSSEIESRPGSLLLKLHSPIEHSTYAEPSLTTTLVTWEA